MVQVERCSGHDLSLLYHGKSFLLDTCTFPYICHPILGKARVKIIERQCDNSPLLAGLGPYEFTKMYKRIAGNTREAPAWRDVTLGAALDSSYIIAHLCCSCLSFWRPIPFRRLEGRGASSPHVNSTCQPHTDRLTLTRPADPKGWGMKGTLAKSSSAPNPHLRDTWQSLPLAKSSSSWYRLPKTRDCNSNRAWGHVCVNCGLERKKPSPAPLLIVHAWGLLLGLRLNYLLSTQEADERRSPGVTFSVTRDWHQFNYVYLTRRSLIDNCDKTYSSVKRCASPRISNAESLNHHAEHRFCRSWRGGLHQYLCVCQALYKCNQSIRKLESCLWKINTGDYSYWWNVQIAAAWLIHRCNWIAEYENVCFENMKTLPGKVWTIRVGIPFLERSLV